ncbi:hypothetical protein NBRC10512_000469 [Rhodotorula toruloides]|uniref:RHTO0S04e10022g1_1 n=2 Tax=Rhodotorula toruloides TaxID=5286 RepID=A0A061AYK0_RHOTO|nr:RNA polymerase-associated protein LEO1 [Rhodotorula toruloides NP11]EMS19235.1 RNA polymerase-associated protein LEO1 [Rhodotorula toruloides NP11]CDR39814.1 RHTO0S04e10022g1_1 [Rhodotorula toruloides]
MDPAIDTGFDEGVQETPNAVNPTSLESDAYGSRMPPELYPAGAPEEPAAANQVPGQDAADVVAAAGADANAGVSQPDAVDELPVPPKEFTEAGGAGVDAMDEDEDMGDDLFGDGGDEDEDEDDTMAQDQPAAKEEPEQAAEEQEADDGLTAEERARRKALEYEEEDYGGGVDDETAHQIITHDELIANIPLANLSVPAGGKVWHAKMPNFLQLKTTAFDEAKWSPEEEEAETESQGRPPLPDENTIRWRWTKDELGQVIKQSNARIVRWSDGSLSLQLGAELFDMSLSLDHSAVMTASAAAGLPIPPAINPVTAGLTASSFDSSRGHGLTYLTARHTYNGQLSEAQASVHGSMSFRPATLTSNTHKRLAGSIRGRLNDVDAKRKVKMQDLPAMDPERQRLEKEKAAQEKARKARKEAAKAEGGRRSGGRRSKKATKIEGLDLSDDEDEDEDAYGGYGTRSQPKRGKGGPLARDYSDDDDGFLAKSDEEMEVSGDEEEIEAVDAAAEREERRRKDRRKSRAEADSDEDDSGGKDEEEQAAAPKRRMVVESDEDE